MKKPLGRSGGFRAVRLGTQTHSHREATMQFQYVKIYSAFYTGCSTLACTCSWAQA